MIQILFLFAFLLSTSHASDFCAANLLSAETPSGYPCKPPNEVSIKDFVFSNLKSGNTSNNPFKSSFTPAFVFQLPGLNGLGLSAARLDLDAGGVVPLHSHPGVSELVIVTQGHITTGFISSENRVFSKTLSKGEVMVIPKGLTHFQVNSGNGKASAFLTFSSDSPTSQILDLVLFGNNLNSYTLQKTTLLDLAQVKKLKGIFGGSEGN